MDNKTLILDIAMNLNRMGNWAADDFAGKQKRIRIFLQQTENYLENIQSDSLVEPMKRSLTIFRPIFKRLSAEAKQTPQDSLGWGETMMTWGNILTHRSKLLK